MACTSTILLYITFLWAKVIGRVLCRAVLLHEEQTRVIWRYSAGILFVDPRQLPLPTQGLTTWSIQYSDYLHSSLELQQQVSQEGESDSYQCLDLESATPSLLSHCSCQSGHKVHPNSRVGACDNRMTEPVTCPGPIMWCLLGNAWLGQVKPHGLRSRSLVALMVPIVGEKDPGGQHGACPHSLCFRCSRPSL